MYLCRACDNLRRYSTAAFLIHLSFVASLFCAYIAFLAGILEALDNRVCIVLICCNYLCIIYIIDRMCCCSRFTSLFFHCYIYLALV